MRKNDSRNLKFLAIVGRLKSRSDRDLLLKALCSDPSIYMTLKKISQLIVSGKTKVTKRLTQTHIRHLSSLAFSKGKLNKPVLLTQSGGFLPAIVSVILQILSSL